VVVGLALDGETYVVAMGWRMAPVGNSTESGARTMTFLVEVKPALPAQK
jgi:hypothetical protein